MIGLLDYGCGNIQAFANVYRGLNIEYQVVDDSKKLGLCDKFILPGVGAFDWAIKKLRSSTFFEELQHRIINQKVPILGVCVGMQMMAAASEEGLEQGLAWVPGTVQRFPDSLRNDFQLPHMGWNNFIPKKDCKLFVDLPNEEFYFLHSYYYQPQHKEHCIGSADYNGIFCAAINNNNIYGTQFHPEKSHVQGEKLLLNFADI